jgi:hypothetical protein
MADLNNVKVLIKRLLAVADNDASTDGEITNAMMAAKGLLASNRIDEAELRAEGNGPQKSATMDRRKTETMTRHCAEWEGSLATFVGRFVGGVSCYYNRPEVAKDSHGIIRRGSRGNPLYLSGMTFYGVDEDVMLATDLFQELSLMIATTAKLKWNGVFRGPGRSYAEGFVAGLASQLASAKKLMRNESASRALVVQDDKRNELVEAESRDWLALKHGIKLRSRSSSSCGSHDGDAYGDGRTDGSAAKVSANRQRKLTS